jgi:hypothetical protein
VASEGLQHGAPEGSRNDRREFDKYRWPPGPHWPRGLEITIYDDGRVKVGGWQTSVVVLDVSNFRSGSSNASGHVIARLQPALDAGHELPTLPQVIDTSEEDGGSAGLSHGNTEPGLSDDAAYERDCWLAIEECRRLGRPYDPHVWVGMVLRSGAATAARQLLASGDIQYGFRRLVEAGRPDLTVEWSVLLPRWRQLFDEQYRDAARWRLQQVGVDPPEGAAEAEE